MFHIIMILLTVQNVLLPTILFVIRANWSLYRGKSAFGTSKRWSLKRGGPSRGVNISEKSPRGPAGGPSRGVVPLEGWSLGGVLL